VKFDEKYKKDALKLGRAEWTGKKGTVAWRSPSNIALIKYWGKHGNQLPQNPSLSFALEKSFTETWVQYRYKGKRGNKVVFTFEKQKNPAFELRIKAFLLTVSGYLPFISQFDFNVESTNSFPHSSGIASSASSMSALALCLVSMERELYGILKDDKTFFEKTSFMARLGSGSASRSVYNGFVVWGRHKDVKGSMDELAIRLNNETVPFFNDLKDAILITRSGRKKVSSSAGHQLMNDHPFATERYRQAKNNLKGLLNALKRGDEQTFISTVENEALSLHAMMITSKDGFTLLNDNTWNIINRIRQYRTQENVFVTFTLDAGPNVHLLYFKKNENQIIQFIQKELLQFCENGKWIDDQAGSGPTKLS
jgi:diphosphomevalonate decarboxylase